MKNKIVSTILLVIIAVLASSVIFRVSTKAAVTGSFTLSASHNDTNSSVTITATLNTGKITSTPSGWTKSSDTVLTRTFTSATTVNENVSISVSSGGGTDTGTANLRCTIANSTLTGPTFGMNGDAVQVTYTPDSSIVSTPSGWSKSGTILKQDFSSAGTYTINVRTSDSGTTYYLPASDTFTIANSTLTGPTYTMDEDNKKMRVSFTVDTALADKSSGWTQSEKTLYKDYTSDGAETVKVRTNASTSTKTAYLPTSVSVDTKTQTKTISTPNASAAAAVKKAAGNGTVSGTNVTITKLSAVNITSLDLSGTKVSNIAFVSNFPSLTSIILKNNDYDSNDAKDVAQTLPSSMKSAATLDFSNNKIDKPSALNGYTTILKSQALELDLTNAYTFNLPEIFVTAQNNRNNITSSRTSNYNNKFVVESELAGLNYGALTASDFDQTTHTTSGTLTISNGDYQGTTYTITIKDTAAPTASLTKKVNLNKSNSNVLSETVQIISSSIINTIYGTQLESIQTLSGWRQSGSTMITRDYTTSGYFEVTYKDIAGNLSTVTFWLTKIPPKIVSIDENAGKVTLTLSEEVDPQVSDISECGFSAWEAGSGKSSTNVTNKWTQSSSNKKVWTRQFTTAAVNTIRLRKTYTAAQSESGKQVTNVSSTDIVVTSSADHEGPNLTINYSSPKTDGSVTVTVTADEAITGVDGWSLEDKTLTKVYYKNTTENITVYDISGNGTTRQINVTNAVDYSQSTTVFAIKNVQYTTNSDGTKTVTITTNKPVNALSGWTRSSDKLTLTKTYTETTTEKITITGEDGGSSERTIAVYIYKNTGGGSGGSGGNGGSGGSGGSGEGSGENGGSGGSGGGGSQGGESGDEKGESSPEVEDVKKTINDDGSTTITITFDKEISEAPEGWTLSADKKTISKTYSIGQSGKTETISVRGLNGLSTTIEVSPSAGSAKITSRDTTTANKAIPQTGENLIITSCILASIFGMLVFGIEYKRLKNYK